MPRFGGFPEHVLASEETSEFLYLCELLRQRI